MRKLTLIIVIIFFLLILLCIFLPFFSNPTPEEKKIAQKNFQEIESLTGGMGKNTSFFAVYDHKYCWVNYVRRPCDKSTYLSACGICFWEEKKIGWRNISAINLTTANEIIPYGTPKFTEIALKCFAPCPNLNK